MKRIQRPLLRTYRRSWGLTLRDLATLLGYRSTAHVSRIENGKRGPNYQTALTCTEIFGAPLHELFPEQSSEVENRLRRRASQLRERWRHTTTATGKRKCELLDRLCLPTGKGNSPTAV